MNTAAFGVWAQDALNALQRIALALEELVALKHIEAEATVGETEAE